jgi:hypothetical protein
LGVLVVCLVGLLWSSRGAPLGVPVADDYTFLARVVFGPVQFFDSMGSPLYWRPISRQAYFLALGGALITSPWLAAAVHLALLCALFLILYRTFRTPLGPLAAVSAAAFPLLSEPTRVLLGWPSGAEYLLAMVGVALALHEARAGRPLTAAAATLFALLSHEAAMLALPLVPIVMWRSGRSRRQVAIAVAVMCAVGMVVYVGHVIASRHGAALPTSGDASLGAPLTVIGLALAAQLNAEWLGDPVRSMLWFSYAVCAIVTLAALVKTRRTPATQTAFMIAIGGAAWFILGSAALSRVWPDWNGWRTVFPGLGLGVAAAALLGRAGVTVQVSWLALRVLSLAVAAPGPEVMSRQVPATTSQLSFQRLVRLQRIVESTRRALHTSNPTLPAGATIRYTWMPNIALFGFQDSLAARVWYRDAALRWGPMGDVQSYAHPPDALVEYIDDTAWPASIIPPDVQHTYYAGVQALTEQRFASADSALAVAADQLPGKGGMAAAVYSVHARVAYLRRDFERAAALNQSAYAANGENAAYWGLAAALAVKHGDLRAAVDATSRALEIDPNQPEARRVAEGLGASAPEP